MTKRKSLALQAVTQAGHYLRVPRLDSIKSRILAFAVLGTLVPASITLGVAYNQNRRALERKITEELRAESGQTARELSVWLKERLYDLRVFAGSDEVVANLSRYSTEGLASPRLREYLRSVHERIPDFEQLIVLDADGRVLATSASHAVTVHMPSEWQRSMRQQGHALGDAFWDEKAGKGKFLIAVPVQRPDGRLMGAFAVEMNLTPLRALLQSYARDSVGTTVYLTTDSGAVIASSREISRDLLATPFPPSLRRLRGDEGSAQSYTGLSGVDVVGTLRSVPNVARWAVVAEVSERAAFNEVRGFRNAAFLVIAVLLVIVGVTAYRFGLLIVRPLERLARGAAAVSMGALDADLPLETGSAGAGEVGALGRVFNHMVARLRAGRAELAAANEALRQKNDELERLSVTDGLTGLTNHRALMQRLEEECTRAQRNKRAFTVLMADVDHFKAYNDEFGHPQGDRVLSGVAGILKGATRSVDCVARYGGEEFAVLLPETEMSGALEVAERIRSRVESAEFAGRRVTVSIGIAEFPRDEATSKGIVSAADTALYVAKRAGRNQVAQAQPAAPKQKLPATRKSRKSTSVKSAGANKSAGAKKKR